MKAAQAYQTDFNSEVSKHQFGSWPFAFKLFCASIDLPTTRSRYGLPEGKGFYASTFANSKPGKSPAWWSGRHRPFGIDWLVLGKARDSK